MMVERGHSNIPGEPARHVEVESQPGLSEPKGHEQELPRSILAVGN